MHFIKCFFVFSFVMAYMWCLEIMTKTFEAVMEEIDIDADPLENNTVRSVTSCGLMCGCNHRCLSFTLCEEAGGWFICRLFDKDRTNNINTKASKSCTYYERYDTFAYNLFKFLKSLNVTIPDHLRYNSPKFNQDFLKEIKTVRNNSVDVIPKLTKSWFVTFDLKLSETFQTTSYYRSIMTIGNAPGTRVPGVYQNPNSKRMHLRSQIKGNTLHKINPGYELNKETFTNVMIIQHLDNIGDYHYRIFINMVEIQHNITPDAEELENMNVYFSDPWFNAADVIVRNIVYSNLG